MDKLSGLPKSPCSSNNCSNWEEGLEIFTAVDRRHSMIIPILPVLGQRRVTAQVSELGPRIRAPLLQGTKRMPPPTSLQPEVTKAPWGTLSGHPAQGKNTPLAGPYLPPIS